MAQPAPTSDSPHTPPASPTWEDARNLAEPSATNPRNLVLCFDGTSNTFSDSLTNVSTLFSLLSADPKEQMCYYQSGLGTGTGQFETPWTSVKALKFVERQLDKAFAWGLGQHIQDGYVFLMRYYQPGDRIFVFGFSRGAYTARALAGMLQQVGLLLKGNEESVGLAYNIYSGGDEWFSKPKCANQSCTTCGELLSDAFKRTFSRPVHVHFTGVWDTVASVGLIPRDLPFSQSGREINHFRHALSLDERRGRFEPQLWMPPIWVSQVIPCTTPADKIRQKIELVPSTLVTKTKKECWFPGAHSNVGGGATATDGDFAPRLSHLSLRWMIREAREYGLKLNYNLVATSPIYSPWVLAAQSLNPFLAPHEVANAKIKRSQDNIYSEAIDRIVQLATEDSPLLREAALAPRRDNLSLRIEKKPGGFLANISEIPSRAVQRAGALFWMALETLPGWRMIWDVDLEQRKYKFGLHGGAGRRLPRGAILHESARIRQEAHRDEFPGADGTSIVEKRYLPKARFKAGEEGTVRYTF